LAFIAVILANESWLSAFPCSFDSDTARLIKKNILLLGQIWKSVQIIKKLKDNNWGKPTH